MAVPNPIYHDECYGNLEKKKKNHWNELSTMICMAAHDLKLIAGNRYVSNISFFSISVYYLSNVTNVKNHDL